MDLKRLLAALALTGALAGPLAGCGDNTDLERGTTECGAAEAGVADEADCADEEPGSPT
ncbi:hypothetical protein [Geodermatophilus marinus]|uniref:hypothetical protein n=1 Tax=Geodermatophilus sp. LHW52908 TaxID=2303986 RepID=UPI001314C9DB|nr:hypothetical protein [Geodermatophilus sp. LHW52908]